MTATQNDESEYRLLADVIIDKLNPTDQDEAEVSILIGSVEFIAEFVEGLPCSCPPDAGPPTWDGECCGRCVALGRAQNVKTDL